MDRMASIFSALLILFVVLILMAATLWLIIPLASGLPWVPALDRRIRAAFRLANVQPGEVVYDLGAGDGRVLVIAAREFGASAVGIEISPIHCLVARIRLYLAGVNTQTSIRWGNFYRSDFSSADVVFIYATSRYANRIIPLLETRLKMGARVVTISSNLEKWQPERIDRENLVFLYRIPPVFTDTGSSLTEQSSV